MKLGGGYGGQCNIINSINSPKEYVIVDIKPALILTQRYLDNYVLKSKVKYLTLNEMSKDSYDLFISNYAFTELNRETQDAYLDKVILNSKKGYITYNDISCKNYNSYKIEELVDLIPNLRIIEEKPLLHKNNSILIWS